MAQEYDPLSVIPSVQVIEQRLRDSEEKTRKLRVLLRTARKIQGTRKPASESDAPKREAVQC